MACDSEWQDVFLEELAASERNAIVGGPFGSDLVSSDYSLSGVPVIRGENLSVGRWVTGDFVFVPKEKAQKLSANTAGPLDVVFTQRGANHYRQVAVVPPDVNGRFVISQSQMKITVDRQKADPLFVYYLFRSPVQQEYLQRNAIQTGVPHTNLAILRKVPLRIPSLCTQCAVSRFLSALDDKIDLNRRMNETLEAMARAIFKDWFVNFGPTRAKMEGRAPYLASEIWALFPDRLDEEEKPVGWHSGTIADYAILNPESWTRKAYPDRIEYVDLSGTKWGTIESVEIHDRDTAPSRAQRILREGDSIVGVVRPGNGSYTLIGREGLTGSTGFAVLRPKSRDAREFTYLAVTAPENIDRLSHLADGAAYPAVRPEVVMATSTISVPLTIMQAFSQVGRPLLDMVEANKRESSTLAATRDLLLPKLMSGEIRVKDAEKQLAAVA